MVATRPAGRCEYLSAKNLESDYQTDNLIGMETTLTAFQRQFAEARKAADRGEIVAIKADDNTEYIFSRRPSAPIRPFADLEELFGSVSIPPKSGSPRERIRNRLRKTAAH